MEVKLISLNVNSITSFNRRHILNDFLKREKPHIMFLCETHLNDKHRLNFPGYKIFLQNRATNGGGVAIFIREEFNAKRMIYNHEFEFEYVAVSIMDNNDVETVFVSIYNPKQSHFMDLLQFDKHNRVIIAGDFNARNINFGDSSDNANGIKLKGFLNEYRQFMLMIPDGPTCYRLPTGSYIDFFITKNVNATSGCHTMDIYSDHCPIKMTVDMDPKLVNKMIFKDFNGVNWMAFNNFLYNHIAALNMPTHSSITNDHLENTANNFNAIFYEAINKFVPSIANRPYIKTNAITKSITNRIKRVCKLIHRPGIITERKRQLLAERRQLQIMLNNNIGNIYHENFKSMLFKMKPGPDTFKTVKRISQYKRKSCDTHNLIYKNNELDKINDEPICELFAEHFRANHELTFNHQSSKTEFVTQTIDSIDAYNNKLNFGLISAHIDSFRDLNAINNTLSPELRDLLTCCEEVIDIVRSRSGKKSYGSDEMPTYAIKRFDKRIIHFITILFNHMIRNNYFPNSWKIAKVTPIPKPNKDSKVIVNYRPISQLSCIGKIFEKIIENKIRNHFIRNNLYDDNQFGFRPGRSTCHALADIQNEIANALNHGRVLMMVLFDIKAAFDTVWHDAIIFKLFQNGVNMNVIKMVRSYLSNRKFYVEFCGEKSNIRDIKAGVPQGGILSPTLYNVFTADMPVSHHVNRSNFADDTMIYSTTANPIQNKFYIQQMIKDLLDYCKNWKLKICPEKTEYLPIYGACTDTKAKIRKEARDCIIDVQDREIRASRKVKYLGLTYDRNARFNGHIDRTITKTNMVKGQLGRIMRNRNVNSCTKSLIYKQAIRPVLTYASPVWLNPSYVSSCQIEKLRKIERTCLRNVSGLYRKQDGKYYSCKRLYEETKITRIDNYMAKLNTNFYNKCKNSDDNRLKAITTNCEYHLKYRPSNYLWYLANNNQLLEDGKFYIFNKKRFRVGDVYNTDQ